MLCLALGEGQVIASEVGGSWYEEGLHLVRSRGLYTRDFLGKGQGGLRTSHRFKAPAKALKESRDKGRKEVLDWYGNVQEYRGDLL